VIANLTEQQLTGRDDSHLITLPSGHQLQAEAASAFELLQADALVAGFELKIASSYRSFERQCAIWNGKMLGLRPVHDDSGRALPLADLAVGDRIHAIMRFSALPGASRHHWGSDLDVFDARAMPENYQLQLSPGEVATGGMFDPLHCWLDEQMGADQSHGFFRPYNVDRGGVAPERWHLSFAPLSLAYESLCSEPVIRVALESGNIEQWASVSADLEALLQRYVSVPGDWCPAQYIP
jgi:LAS superfamily LD-carboxypeptidase LdcB